MSAQSHTEWEIVCDGPGPCPLQYGPEPVVAAVLRKRAKRAGWAVNVPNRDHSRTRLDFCPSHRKPEPREG